jgi:type VI secretion system secreted protein VgrG
MPGELSQRHRIAALETPLGSDVLVLKRLEAVEGLSELFEYRIDALSTKQDIPFAPIIGQNCCIQFKSYNGERFFNGKLVEAQWVGKTEHRHFAYRLVLRPWLWLLSHQANCRIFENKNAPDVISEVFKQAGFQAPFEKELSRQYPVMEYCVQYRETDLAFVSRLMEHFGIFTYFKHTRSEHTLVMTDANSCLKPIAGAAKIPFISIAEKHHTVEEHIYQWTKERRFRTSKVVLKEYDFLKPSANLVCEDQADEGYNPKLELYEYPGKYPREEPDKAKERAHGDRLAKVRLEAEQAIDQRRRCTGDAALLYPGGLFTLTGHDTDDGKYAVVRASHSIEIEHYRSSASTERRERYHGHYELLRSDRQFRAPLVTPKPLIHGPQTAKVIGLKGEEIDVDKHGRIKLRFHWDRKGKDDKLARRVRVAQIWSGKNWGGQVIPRIGQEVVVEFLDGDPDRPLVVGTVYNEEYRYPYEMPDKKTMSGVKSESTKDGAGGFNEFHFEDKKGSEKVYKRAEKDYQLLVRNTETRDIGEIYDKKGPSRKATLKHGNDEVYVEDGHQTVDVSDTILIKAGKKITLKVGDTTIVLTPSSIKLKSTKIDVKGVKTSVDGAATLTLTGGVVKIN